MDNLFNLLLFFAIYSFFGWLLETIFASINERRFINRGFLAGFFCPIYGFGALMIIQTSGWVNIYFKDHLTALVISLLFSIFLVTVLEYITGFFLEKIFNCKWWDYSDESVNLYGYICLKYSLIWGVLAFLLVEAAHPIISGAVSSISMPIKSYIALALILYLLTDTTKSVIDTLNLRAVILSYSYISVNKYYERLIRHKRFFLAFPRLLILTAGTINRDIRSILNERVEKAKVGVEKAKVVLKIRYM